MNTPLPRLPLSAPIPDVAIKKRVLLIDTSHAKRDLRAEVLRKLGTDVDSAVYIAAARAWCKPALYDLVLINVAKQLGQCDAFCGDLRSAPPPQRMAFLVGQPEHIADSPNPDQELLVEIRDGQAVIAGAKGTFAADAGGTTECWGILEASRRIAAARSASVRSQAMRALPPPP